MTIKITGMTCPHCEMAVRKALAQVDGVTNVVAVDRIRDEAIIEGKPNREELIEAVKRSGYNAEIA